MAKEIKCTKGTGCERVYSFLVEYIRENGYSPSIKEICIGTNLSSTSSVYNNLKKLKMLGKIDIKKNTCRAIKLEGYQFVKVGESA